LKNRKKVKTYEIRNVEIPQEAYGCFEIEWLNTQKEEKRIDIENLTM
jgi:hypothetical protein